MFVTYFYIFIEQVIQSDTCQSVYVCVEGYAEVVTGWMEVESTGEGGVTSLGLGTSTWAKRKEKATYVNRRNKIFIYESKIKYC